MQKDAFLIEQLLGSSQPPIFQYTIRAINFPAPAPWVNTSGIPVTVPATSGAPGYRRNITIATSQGVISFQTNRIRFLRHSFVTVLCIGCYLENRVVTNPVRFAETHVFTPSLHLTLLPFPKPLKVKSSIFTSCPDYTRSHHTLSSKKYRFTIGASSRLTSSFQHG